MNHIPSLHYLCQFLGINSTIQASKSKVNWRERIFLLLLLAFPFTDSFHLSLQTKQLMVKYLDNEKFRLMIVLGSCILSFRPLAPTVYFTSNLTSMYTDIFNLYVRCMFENWNGFEMKHEKYSRTMK